MEGDETETIDIGAIKMRFMNLTNSDKLDKDAALQVTRLQNYMEMHYTNIIHEKDREIESLKFELNTEHIRKEHETLMNRCSKYEQDTKKFETQLEEHLNTINRLSTEISRKKK